MRHLRLILIILVLAAPAAKAQTTSQPAVMSGATVTTTSAVISAAKSRRYLQLMITDTTGTVYLAFDTPAVASAAIPGQLVLQAGGNNKYWIEWNGGFVPANQINAIAGTGTVHVTVME